MVKGSLRTVSRALIPDILFSSLIQFISEHLLRNTFKKYAKIYLRWILKESKPESVLAVGSDINFIKDKEEGLSIGVRIVSQLAVGNLVAV